MNEAPDEEEEEEDGEGIDKERTEDAPEPLNAQVRLKALQKVLTFCRQNALHELVLSALMQIENRCLAERFQNERKKKGKIIDFFQQYHYLKYIGSTYSILKASSSVVRLWFSVIKN